MSDVYQRFEVSRPEYLGDDQWSCIGREVQRLARSLDAEDGAQAFSDLKCLVESIARVTLDIDGTPAAPDISFDTLVTRAHTLLAGQPGHELANTSPFGNLATQASKIARNLGAIRNEFGGGHGRARTPDLQNEMLILALDGGLLWARWALRRLGYFSEGRPAALINDLVTEPKSFYAGILGRRLAAANLPGQEPRHQRSIGIAVGQRIMQETFVVRWDGLDPCLASDDLNTWPRDYRIGLSYGLWFDLQDRLTLTPVSVEWTLRVLEPVPDGAEDLAEWVDRITRTRVPGALSADWPDSFNTWQFVRDRIALRPTQERPALQALADNIKPEAPF